MYLFIHHTPKQDVPSAISCTVISAIHSSLRVGNVRHEYIRRGVPPTIVVKLV